MQKVEVKYEKQKVVVKYENEAPRAEQALLKGEKEKETSNRRLKSLVDGGASIRKDLVQEEELGHVTWSVAPVICSTQLPTRSVDANVVARSIRELLWEAPSQPPSIVTPSSLHFIKREGDMDAEFSETCNSNLKSLVDAEEKYAIQDTE